MNQIRRWLTGVGGGLMLAAGVILTAGCATRGAGDRDVIREATPVPFGGASARVTIVNEDYKFVVLDFSDRTMPKLGTELSVYRGEKKIGRVRLTEPSRSRFATADVLDGQVRVGDEAR